MPGSGDDEGLTPKVRGFTTGILDFLSTASNETLCACIAGSGALTYLFLGRVGLVLIGIIGGVVLHATWEGDGTDEQQKARDLGRRKEVGLDIVQRLLDWQDKTNSPQHDRNAGIDGVEVMLSLRNELDFEGFRPATASALTSLVDAVIRDYVK